MDVNKTNLSMVRGDSETIIIELAGDASLASGDVIEMTVRSNNKSRTVVFHKVVTEFTDGMAVIEILPEDTSNQSFGQYVYDVQLTDSHGNVTTIIKPAVFNINEEVTYG